jgi:hypothetical protein
MLKECYLNTFQNSECDVLLKSKIHWTPEGTVERSSYDIETGNEWKDLNLDVDDNDLY